jgi:hypothetical protein
MLGGVSFVVLSSALSLAISGPSAYFDVGFVIVWLFAVPGVVGLA